jgi:hypothetical protein
MPIFFMPLCPPDNLAAPAGERRAVLFASSLRQVVVNLSGSAREAPLELIATKSNGLYRLRKDSIG